MKRTRTVAAITVGLGLAAASGAAWAHHSFAMFDFTKQTTFQGTVKEFRWTNPHVSLWITRDTPPGKPPEVWNLELTSPGNLTRVGWSKRSFNPGERVEVVTNPLRNGQTGGGFVKGTVLATGKVWTSSLREANGRANIQ
jgi:hypothetical protein